MKNSPRFKELQVTDFPFNFYSLSRKLIFTTSVLLLLMIGCVPTSYYYNLDLGGGNNAYDAGKYDNAVNYYSAAIKKDPKNAVGYEKRALAYSKMNKNTEAMDDIDKAIELDHKKWELYYTRATLFEKQEMYNQAITDYTTYITKADKNAANKTATNNTAKGVAAAANQSATSYYLGYWGRGKCYMYTKKMNEAIEDFSQAIKLTPTDINLYAWRADCYLQEKNYALAMKDYEVFVEKNPKNYKQQFSLGVCYVNVGAKDKATSLYLKFAEYDPSIKTFFPADHQLDFFNSELRHRLTLQFLEEANTNLEEARSTTSKSLLDISLNTAFDKLKESWGYALNITTDDRIILDTIVSKMYYIYPKLKVKPAVPEYVRKFTVQATSNVEEKKYPDAIEKYQLALGICPYYPYAHFNLAMLYATTNQYKKAMDQMNSYLKLAPDASDARAAQDKIYEWEIKVKD